MIIRQNIIVYILLIASSALFLLILRLTHIEFLNHLAAIPLEILVAVFIVERYLLIREKKQKRKQLMYIKSCLFRGQMHNLFTMNFLALNSPSITLSKIKHTTLEEMKKIRKEADVVEYKSLEIMEPIIMEYVNTQPIWQNFLEIAIRYDFEDIFHEMIGILHFIQDVKTHKAINPDKLFIHQATNDDQLMQKVKTILGNGIRKFLDYVIELKEEHPSMFYEVMSDYESRGDALNCSVN